MELNLPVPANREMYLPPLQEPKEEIQNIPQNQMPAIPQEVAPPQPPISQEPTLDMINEASKFSALTPTEQMLGGSISPVSSEATNNIESEVIKEKADDLGKSYKGKGIFVREDGPEGDLKLNKQWVNRNKRALKDLADDLGFESPKDFLSYLADAKDERRTEEFMSGTRVKPSKINEIFEKASNIDPKIKDRAERIKNEFGIPTEIVDDLVNYEGGYFTTGYVPRIGKSGVTISSGFDVGQMDERDLENLDILDSLKEKIKPYLELKRGEASKKLKQEPLEITPEEALTIGYAVKERQISQANKRLKANTDKEIKDLDDKFKEPFINLSFQYGVYSSVTNSFGEAAAANDTAKAKKILSRVVKRYKSRYESMLKNLK